MLQYEATLARDSVFSSLVQKRVALHVFLFGGSVALALYNLFLFVSTRDKNYVLFVLYSMVGTLMCLNFLGYTYQYIWPDSPSLNPPMRAVLSGLFQISILVYSIKFLQLRKRMPLVWSVACAALGGYLLFVISAVFGNYTVFLKVFMASIVVSWTCCFGSSLWLWFGGVREARYFSIAGAVLVASWLMYTYSLNSDSTYSPLIF